MVRSIEEKVDEAEFEDLAEEYQRVAAEHENAERVSRKRIS
jgi:hypothetical protein